MNPAIANAFVIFLYILVGLVIVRAFLSWFPSMRDGEFARFVHRATEPLIEPVRRVLPTGSVPTLAPVLNVKLLPVGLPMVNDTFREIHAPFASSTRIGRLKMPVFAGVPLMTPVAGSSVSPGGMPDGALHV